MRKSLILISIFILFLSISSVNAELFGPYTIECKQFSIEVPEDYHKSAEWTDNLFDDCLYIWSDDDLRNLEMWEVPSFDSFNRSNTEEIIDSYEDNDLKIDKCYDSEKSVVVDSHSVYGSNYTYAEFSIDNHHYVVINEYKGDLKDLDMKSDANLVKEIKNTVKIKN